MLLLQHSLFGAGHDLVSVPLTNPLLQFWTVLDLMPVPLTNLLLLQHSYNFGQGTIWCQIYLTFCYYIIATFLAGHHLLPVTLTKVWDRAPFDASAILLTCGYYSITTVWGRAPSGVSAIN